MLPPSWFGASREHVLHLLKQGWGNERGMLSSVHDALPGEISEVEAILEKLFKMGSKFDVAVVVELI